MLAEQPQTTAEMLDRFAEAVRPIWDVYKYAAMPDHEKPGGLPAHVFDFHNGLRIIVSTDAFGPALLLPHLHVSASTRPDTPIEANMIRVARRHGVREADKRFLQACAIEFIGISGGTSLNYFSGFSAFIEAKGVPHWHMPQDDSVDTYEAVMHKLEEMGAVYDRDPHRF